MRTPPPTPPPREPERDWEPDVVAARRAWTGHPLPHVGGEPVPTVSARGNVEGMLGYAQVPLGIAGPVVIRGEVEGAGLVPLATTEGSLVASYQRGIKVCNAAGGVHVRVLRDALVVWPTLAFDTVEEALAAGRRVDADSERLIAAAQATTSHGTVLGLGWELLGRRLLLRLELHTGDAHGINMATRAAAAVCAGIPGARQVLLHGYDVEKRASATRGRGKWVVAEVRVPAAIVASHWRCRAADMAELWATYALAFGRMGTHTHALQVANGLGAFYVATGQDVAYLAESAACTLCIEDRDGDVHATLDLPNLHTATVGGGTGKGTAAECRDLVGASSAREQACVLAAALLAGDLNLAASFVADDFVGVHERMGRNRP
jgi:hydroxymethylglutaryl-CoA reductase (NADPH)